MIAMIALLSGACVALIVAVAYLALAVDCLRADVKYLDARFAGYVLRSTYNDQIERIERRMEEIGEVVDFPPASPRDDRPITRSDFEEFLNRLDDADREGEDDDE
jgi:tetrahydromethanopterin S-methyltransferase subunit G